MIGGLFRFLAILGSLSWADAEIVEVEYRNPVDLTPFVCQDITRSSLISRVCYDRPNRYMLVQSRAAYHDFCAVPDQVVTELLNAPSMGRFFRANIRGIGPDGPYDCPAHQAPSRS